jgi:hypothetical protein
MFFPIRSLLWSGVGGGGRQKKVQVETKKLHKFSQLNIRYRYKRLVFKHEFPVKILMFSQQKNGRIYIIMCAKLSTDSISYCSLIFGRSNR